MEVGIHYELVGPDGTRAVWNDINDPDFVGYLDPDQGLTGLLDTADVRQTVSDKVEFDGQAQGNNWLAGKTGTIQGVIYPTDSLTMNLMADKIRRASRALRVQPTPNSTAPIGPAYLRWTHTGYAMRQIELYRQGRVTITNRRPKQFLIPMSSPDSYIYSAALHSQVITGGAASSGDAGFVNPMTNPITTSYQATAQQFVVNAGDVGSYPSFVIAGPVTNPTLRNNTTGLQWTLATTINSGQTITVDAKHRTVLLGGTSDYYNTYATNFAGNTWWSLIPGANDIRFLSAAFSAGAQATVLWRDAWE